VVAFPVPKKNNLQFPKPGSREVATRDESIPNYKERRKYGRKHWKNNMRLFTLLYKFILEL
jgi:hypothetical protein